MKIVIVLLIILLSQGINAQDFHIYYSDAQKALESRYVLQSL